MRLIATLLLSCLLVATSYADPIRPYLGLGVNLNQTNDQYVKCVGNRENSVCRSLPDHSGLALQLEGGITNSTYSAYLGYRNGSSSLTGDDMFDVLDGQLHVKYGLSEINSQHFVVGGRVQPYLSKLPEWLRPVVGLGLTWGHATKKTEWTLTEDTGFNESYKEELESEDKYGGILELGFAIRPSTLPLQAFLLFEVHAYNATFSGQEKIGSFTLSPTADMYEIRENGVKIGLSYYFKKFAESADEE
ncbi:MAG: hypothetical protein H6508_00700 [Calditrichaeota bacterium]|nr:hypothetical protein [Calditrichota bacterium]